jgi:class 3 adenylate cyclase
LIDFLKVKIKFDLTRCQNGKVPAVSSSETFEAALLFADVSKFSSLAERLSHHKDLDGGSDR